MSIKVGLSSWKEPGYWDACKQSLDAISDPVERFKAFDELTDQLLRSTSFDVLTQIAQDPKFAESTSSRNFTLGHLGPNYIADIEEIVQQCQQLSDKTIKPLSISTDQRLWAICKQPGSYIETKLFHVLGRIVMSKNFAASSQGSHPLNSLNKKTWELQLSNHGSTCPCNESLKTRFPKV